MAPTIKILAPVLALSCSLASCASSFLQTKDFGEPYYFSIDSEAEIANNEENTEILKTVQKYREAIVNRDVATLKGLVSKDYYENGSTTDNLTDDYGNERIEEILNDYLAQSVKDIRYSIDIKDLSSVGPEYYVDYQYIWNFRYEVAGQSYWQSKNDTNRMTLIQEDGAWKIKGGL